MYAYSSYLRNAFDDDLGLTELNINGIELSHDSNNDDTNSVCSSLGSGFHQPSKYYIILYYNNFIEMDSIIYIIGL